MFFSNKKDRKLYLIVNKFITVLKSNFNKTINIAAIAKKGL